MGQDSKKEFEDLIDKLDDDSIEKRTAAVKGLIKFGVRLKFSASGLGLLLFLGRMSREAQQGSAEHKSGSKEVIERVLEEALDLKNLARETDDEISTLEGDIKLLDGLPGELSAVLIKMKKSRIRRLKELKGLKKIFLKN
jgi:hypothetical protein